MSCCKSAFKLCLACLGLFSDVYHIWYTLRCVCLSERGGDRKRERERHRELPIHDWTVKRITRRNLQWGPLTQTKGIVSISLIAPLFQQQDYKCQLTLQSPGRNKVCLYDPLCFLKSFVTLSSKPAGGTIPGLLVIDFEVTDIWKYSKFGVVRLSINLQILLRPPWVCKARKFTV